DDQLIEPARERRLETKLRETACELDAGQLRNVFGIRAMSAPLERDAIDRRVVQIQQLAEGGDVPALRTPHETSQICGVHRVCFVGLSDIRRNGARNPWSSPHGAQETLWAMRIMCKTEPTLQP